MPASLLLLDDADEWLDTEGRPLGEQRASCAQEIQLVTELKICPYSGSRHHHPNPMNVSALQQIARRWDAILETLAAVRARWLTRAGAEQMTFGELWRAATAVSLLPSYLVHVRASSTSQVPALAASLYKTVVGVVALLEGMFGELDFPEDAPIDRAAIEAILGYGDARGYFIGKAQVCSASPRLMRDALAALAFGNGEGEQPRMPEELGDPDRHLAFAELAMHGYLVRRNFARELRERCAELEALLEGSEQRTATSPRPAPRPRLGGVDAGWHAMSEAQRTRAKTRLTDLVLGGDPTSTWRARALSGLDVASAAARERAAAWKKSLDRMSLKPLPEPVLRRAMDYLELETELLGFCARGDRRLEAIIGPIASSSPRDGDAISRAFGPTPWSVLEATVG